MSDALSTLRWGVRHYVLLFAGCVLLGLAVLTPVLTREAAYEASTLVVAQRWDTGLSRLPASAEAAFDDGGVAGAIAAQFGNVGAVQDIVPRRVSLHTEPDSIILRVTGHAASGPGAADLANAAAAAFVSQLNQAGDGTAHFAIQSMAAPSASQRSGYAALPAALALALAAGLILGLATVALLLLVRRPILDATDAIEATGIPVLGTLTVPRMRAGRYPAPSDVAGLVPFCRRLLGEHPRIVLLAVAGRSDLRRRQVCLALAALLRRARSVRVLTDPPVRVLAPGAAAPGAVLASTADPDITLVDGLGRSAAAGVTGSSMAILLVPLGVSETVLRSAADSTDALVMLRVELLSRYRLRWLAGRR